MEEYNRVSSFIQAFLRENDSLLEEIREEAQKDAVPIIRDETAALLRVCLEINKPKSILELGTAVGYSAPYAGLFRWRCVSHYSGELSREDTESGGKLSKEPIQGADFPFGRGCREDSERTGSGRAPL